MKFQPDSAEGINLITRFERAAPGGAAPRVWVGATPYAHGVLVPRVGAVEPWQRGGFDALEAADFERVAALAPEVVLLGSGARLRFPAPALLRALIERGVGVETMDTAAACRTYNVLAAEGRSVLAALIIESDTSGFGPK